MRHEPCHFNLLQNFKNNSLLSHESEVNKLQEEGDRLIELKHPASATIQVTGAVLHSQLEASTAKLIHVSVPGSKRYSAGRVAEIPQLVHLSRNPFGQRGGVQAGKHATVCRVPSWGGRLTRRSRMMDSAESSSIRM